MSTIFKKRFASEEDILASGDEDFIARCQRNDNITILLQDGDSGIYLTYFQDDGTVGIVKKGNPSPRLRVYSVRITRKALQFLPNDIAAWIKKEDSKTKRLLCVLGFSFKIRKMSYDKYIR